MPRGRRSSALDPALLDNQMPPPRFPRSEAFARTESIVLLPSCRRLFYQKPMNTDAYSRSPEGAHAKASRRAPLPLSLKKMCCNNTYRSCF